MFRYAILSFVSITLLASTGKETFQSRCAGCHGSDARGGGKGPGLAANSRLAKQTREQLRAVIQRGFPDSGMPPFDLPPADPDAVAGYIHDLNVNVKRG